jgi:hypothetical protein
MICRKKAQNAPCGQPQPRRRRRMADEKGLRNVKGMTVRGIILKSLFPIPLTTIPLTLAFSGKKIAHQEYSRTAACRRFAGRKPFPIRQREPAPAVQLNRPHQ